MSKGSQKDKAARRIFRRDPSLSLAEANRQLREDFGGGMANKRLRQIKDRAHRSIWQKSYRFLRHVKQALFGEMFWQSGLRLRQVAIGIAALVPLTLLLQHFWTPSGEFSADILWLFAACAQVLGAMFAFVLVMCTFKLQSIQARHFASLDLLRRNIDALKAYAYELPEEPDDIHQLLKVFIGRLESYILTEWPHRFHEDSENLELYGQMIKRLADLRDALPDDYADLAARIGARSEDVEIICNNMKLDTVIGAIGVRGGVWATPLLELLCLTVLSLAMCVAVPANLFALISAGDAALLATSLVFLYLVTLSLLRLWWFLVVRVSRDELDSATLGSAVE